MKVSEYCISCMDCWICFVCMPQTFVTIPLPSYVEKLKFVHNNLMDCQDDIVVQNFCGPLRLRLVIFGSRYMSLFLPDEYKNIHGRPIIANGNKAHRAAAPWQEIYLSTAGHHRSGRGSDLAILGLRYRLGFRAGPDRVGLGWDPIQPVFLYLTVIDKYAGLLCMGIWQPWAESARFEWAAHAFSSHCWFYCFDIVNSVVHIAMYCFCNCFKHCLILNFIFCNFFLHLSIVNI